MNDLGTLINTLYHHDNRIRTQAENELRKLGSAAIEALVQVVRGEHPAPKIRRVTGLLGFGPSQQELALEARLAAARLLADCGDAYAAHELAALIPQAPEKLQHAAALALGKLNDRRAVEPLIQALYDTDFAIRAEVADMLGELGDRRAVDALVRVLLNDGHPVPRWKAARALGRLRDGRALPALISTLEGLLSLPAEEWAPQRSDAYAEDEPAQIIWTTCAYILDALTLINDPRAVPILERLMQEAPARTIREKAERCLQKIKGLSTKPAA